MQQLGDMLVPLPSTVIEVFIHISTHGRTRRCLRSEILYELKIVMVGGSVF